jgi:hypothetical protein
VFPDDIELGLYEQEDEPDDREGDGESPSE